VFPEVVAPWTIGNRPWEIGFPVRCGDDLRITLGLTRQPHPAVAELLGAGIIEFALELFEAAEGFLLTSAIGLEGRLVR